MVQIVNYEKRQNKDGEEFFVLVLAGGLEMIKSQSSGKFYATRKESTVSCTMTKEQCKELIGQQLPGSIKRVICEPYEMVDEKTGEMITHHHRWDYSQESDSLAETILEGEAVIGVHPMQDKLVL